MSLNFAKVTWKYSVADAKTGVKLRTCGLEPDAAEEDLNAAVRRFLATVLQPQRDRVNASEIGPATPCGCAGREFAMSALGSVGASNSCDR